MVPSINTASFALRSAVHQVSRHLSRATPRAPRPNAVGCAAKWPGVTNALRPPKRGNVHPLYRLPTVNTPLEYFAGDWSVRGIPGQPQFSAKWHNRWLMVTHPATPGHKPVHYTDFFSYENEAYVRHICGRAPGIMFLSGGWQGDRWEWVRADCSARITYDRLDANTMIVTEEDRIPDAPGRTYRVTRRYEARRSG